GFPLSGVPFGPAAEIRAGDKSKEWFHAPIMGSAGQYALLASNKNAGRPGMPRPPPAPGKMPSDKRAAVGGYGMDRQPLTRQPSRQRMKAGRKPETGP
ncbi:MAG: hypothetical protein LBD37_08500, partial [Treponema sp.]|nr:hypothetical protein [Treponema sp.]